MLRKYHIKDTSIAKESADKLILRLQRVSRQKLSWAETAKAMAAAREPWFDWDDTAGDGIHGL